MDHQERCVYSLYVFRAFYFQYAYRLWGAFGQGWPKPVKVTARSFGSQIDFSLDLCATQSTFIRDRINSVTSPLRDLGRSTVLLQCFMPVATSKHETEHTEGQRTEKCLGTPLISSKSCTGSEELASGGSPQNSNVLSVIICMPQALLLFECDRCICKTC